MLELLRGAAAVEARANLLVTTITEMLIYKSKEDTSESNPRLRPRRYATTLPSSPPMDAWADLDEIDLGEKFLLRVSVLQNCQSFLKGR